MKFATIRDFKELQLPGIEIQADSIDNSLRTVSFYVGTKLAFRLALDSYNLVAQKVAPPEMRNVRRLSGTVLGIPVQQDFDSKYEADDARRKYESGLCDEKYSTLAISEASVPVD